MTFNHLVLVGGGHSNVLLMHKWLMHPKLMPSYPVTIISRESHLVYSAKFPSVIANVISFEESLIDIASFARSSKVAFIQDEVKNIQFKKNKIILRKRPPIDYSDLVINCGIRTKVSKQFEDLVQNKIAFPIKPFSESYKYILEEDKFNINDEPPFVIVGSGLAAIEIAFALRKRWSNRSLILVCDLKKLSNKFIFWLRKYQIQLKPKIDFNYKKILLCTGNAPHIWIENNYLKLDSRGRIITKPTLQIEQFSNVYAIGDCAYSGTSKSTSSGILAVKAVKSLAKNIQNKIIRKRLNRWHPQNKGLQIVNLFNHKKQSAFAVYGKLIIGPNINFWKLKNKLDNDFLTKLKPPVMRINSSQENMDCRGCASKVSQSTLNKALKNSQLIQFVNNPEDASEIFNNKKEIILQSIDGFPALVSDPWLNARITTLHACSDLWASGVKLSSAQALISLPKINYEFQNYIFSQSLNAIKSTIEELGGVLIGGHTFETRNFVTKPYEYGIDISLSVQGILKNGKKPWKKNGIKEGDILMLSRPLGVGIIFAAQMQNINLLNSSSLVYNNLRTSQQHLLDQIFKLQDMLGEDIINAATDITGFGLIGHLKEMINSSNLQRKNQNLKEIRAVLNLMSFKAYPSVRELIKQGVKSTLFNENKKIYDEILEQEFKRREIIFDLEEDLSINQKSDLIDLLLDPQTGGPLLISCKPKYEKYLINNWYKIGKIS